MSKRGSRGKFAEKEVEKVLEQYNRTHLNFAYHRLPDARSARNFLKAQPADFMYWWDGVGGFIEVKETKHSSRLAKDKISQMPILKKFALAGARSLVIVFHSTLQQWRIAPLSFFVDEVPSWDLSPLPTFDSAEEALKSCQWR